MEGEVDKEVRIGFGRSEFGNYNICTECEENRWCVDNCNQVRDIQMPKVSVMHWCIQPKVICSTTCSFAHDSGFVAAAGAARWRSVNGRGDA